MVKIIADSTCDLSQELLARYDVDTIPLYINLGEDAYLDGRNVTPDEIFAWSDAHKTTPKTAAFSVETAMEAMKPYLDAGREIVCFSISASMSGSYNAMRLAAQMLGCEDRVQVIDSKSLSTGIGLLVMEAADMAKAGKTAGQIAQEIEEIIPRVHASFVVDTLTYLHRGGRCSSVAALAGGVLKLHPMIVVTDGSMAATKKYRGKMDHVIMNYVHDLEPQLKRARENRVFITHSGCDEALLKSVHEYLCGLGRFKEILTVRAGGVISSHCGPGTLGVLFIEEA